ncbi:hypothetical protein DL765_005929 [Monosporascus sp. GIB2]|nr:hypothetical protein DL765_005929 [Monosporascus sp. GIB2]
MDDFDSPDAAHGQAKRHGLFRLHPKPQHPYNHLDFDVDIVAVHGLGGHAFNTWTDKDGHLWLRDSLPARVPRVRVMTFGYDSTVLFGSSRASINDFALDLTTRLEVERQHTEERRRPLVFVCHSLGGVVFKEFLVHLSLQLDRCHDLLRSVCGVVFMGTPHRGSRAAAPARLLSRIINVATLGSAVRSDLIRTLQVSSIELETISRHATELLKELTIVSFYEQKPIGPALVVEPFSAILGLPNERAIPINADHRKIAQTSPRKEQRYLPVWTSIKELVEASSMTLAESNRQFLDKLFCVDYKAAQLRPRQPQRGTCEWILSDPTYVSWLNSEQSSMLLLAGQAGTGKSVLTRYLAESIQSGGQSDGPGTGYLGVSFFCSYNETALNYEEAVLRSLLHQLIQLNVRSAALVRSRLEKRNSCGLSISTRPDDLWASLTDVLSMSTMKRIFLVVDAIEELGAEIALSILSRLWKTTHFLNQTHPENRLRILVSSRRNPAYASALPNLTILSMKKAQIQRDIEEYLRHEVEEFATKNSAFRASVSAGTRREIVTSILARVDGMFLQAALAWGEFRKGIMWNQSVVAKKLKSLDALPPGMAALYDKVINELNESIRDDAFVIFSVLAAAARPLSEPELSAILGVCNSNKDIVCSTDLEPFKDLYQIMEQSFPNLITIQDDNRATFVHLSFREYLQSRQDFQDALLSGRREITRTCLLYLKLRDMLRHAHDGSGTAVLCSNKTAGKVSIYTLESLRSRESNACFSPLLEVIQNVPAPAKLQLVQNFKEHGYDLDEKWSRRSCGRPLQHCCSMAGLDATLKDVAFLMLRLGANPSLPPRPWRSNLRRAMEAEAWDLYDTLLRHPLTDPNAPDQYDQTVLHALVREGPLNRISELVDVLHGVDVNIQDIDGYTPIHLATSVGRPDVVRKLLNVPGIRLDLADRQGRTALTLATYWGMKSIALVLIEHSEAFPLPEAGQLSALVFAAKHGQKDLCTRLLELSRYQNLDCHIDIAGRGILHLAAINNWAEVLVDCIGHGASAGLNVNKIDHAGKTALHHAAALGNVEACSVLTERGGASLTLQDRNGRTAAMAAADAGFKDALVVLLKSGRVNPNQRDVEGRNLAHWAATLDCVDVMELLVGLDGASVEWARRDKHGKRPVDIAGMCGTKYVGLFLAERTPGWRSEQPDWNFEEMYRSRTVEITDDALLLQEEEDLLIKNSRRQKRKSDEEWEDSRRRYPDSRFGLVHVESDQQTIFADMFKARRI